MNASCLWKKLFNKKHIKNHYYESVCKKPSIGLDRITPLKFEETINENVELIARKVQDGSYNFTRYKQLLLLKGPDKLPRKINIPTLRDKLTTSILNELLVGVYGDDCKTDMPHIVIKDIVLAKEKYTHYIKIDIESFYGSIDHELLSDRLKNRIRKNEIKTLISKAIANKSLSQSTGEEDKSRANTGLPEGIPISNTLANIFLIGLDNKYKNNKKIAYYRYVDDILVLADEKNYLNIYDQLIKDLAELKLKTNKKSTYGLIKDSFEYLGYTIDQMSVSIRKSSVQRLEKSIEKLFRSIKNNNKYLEWKLNLKITGFVIDNNKYGWLFFYSQMEEIQLLYHLDNLVNKLIKRYGLEEKVKPKRFVRVYHEIKYALHTTTYIPNMDKYSYKEKKEILQKIYSLSSSQIAEYDIEYLFRNTIRKEIRDTEKDIQHFS